MRNEFQIEVMWPADTDMGLRSWPMVNAWLADRGMRSAWVKPESSSGVWRVGAMVKPGLPRLKRAVQAVSISGGASMRMPWEAGTVVEVLEENRDMRLVRQGSWLFWVNVKDLDLKG